jgi:histidyl-tRNA synthetase
MNFQAVKGTRDFYPDAMRLRNWITDAWRRVSLRNGFEEYDSPIFEYLDLFTAKSGPEIAEQLFSFTDRGGRNLAIRPEMTPSLARMVNAKINSLPRPVKWFAVGRACRAENPQKGRLREFFQWNIDIIGEDSPVADAECIFVAVDLLREIGLTPREAVVRVGSRQVLVAALRAAGVEPGKMDDALTILDRRPKLTDEQFRKLLQAGGLTEAQMQAASRLQVCRTLEEAQAATAGVEGLQGALGELRRLWQYLDAFGVAPWCRLDLGIVRALAYYTGIVWEVFDAANSLRAVAGGGRYDDLLEVLGGPKVGGTGFGMGDVVLGILLEEKGKLPADLRSQRLDFFVVDAEEGQPDKVLEVAAALRGHGLSADFSYKRQSIGKQLKEANRRGAARAAIVKKDTVTVKDLASGSQQDRLLADFLARPIA